MFDDELDSWRHLAVVHLIDGFLGALRSILFVRVVWIIEADEGKLTELVLLDNE